jgi:hypothetical protein
MLRKNKGCIRSRDEGSNSIPCSFHTARSSRNPCPCSTARTFPYRQDTGPGADVHDRACPLRAEVRQKRVGGVEQPEDVGVERHNDFFGRVLLDGATLQVSGVVEEKFNLATSRMQ